MTENKFIHPDAIEYDQWRPRFLDTILKVSCGLGIVLIGVIVPLVTLLELTVLGVVYLLLLAVTFIPMRYEIKAGTFLTIGYFIGLFTLTRFGPWSDAVIFFLTCTVFASLLFDRQIDRYILVLNSTTIIVMGALDFLHIFQITSAQTPPANLGSWITYCVDYIVLATVLLWAINLVKQEFRSVTEKFQSTLKSFFSERSELEQRVEERAAGLIKKTDQFRAAAYIAQQTTEVDDLSLLLKVVVDLVADQFGFYHTGIFLMNETSDILVLQAASSNGGKRMVEMGTSLPVGTQSIVGYAAVQKNYHIVDDTGADADLFNNPDLPDTRSEIAFPLIIRNRVLGVLDIQSDQPQAFSVNDVDVWQTLAGQVAAAIENARLLDESRAALMQLEAVTTFRTREAWRQKIQNQLHAFTYTPLGIRADAFSEEKDKALTVPIALRGQKIGSLSVSRKDDESWNKVDEELINEVAYQVGLVVDNIRLLEDATQRAQQEKTVGELAVRFSQSLDLDSLLQTAARELGQVSEVSEVSVFIGELPEQSSQKRRSKRTTG
jgi:GAF domain-containing protein/large-conductance mechanosensitive channel